MRKITEKHIKDFINYLIEEEKAPATQEKYHRDIISFYEWLDDKRISKLKVLNYKAFMMKKYAISSVNSKLSSLNSFFEYHDWHELRVKTVKVQKKIFIPNDIELTKEEYIKLLKSAEKNDRLYLLLQTICSTGIRVSELRFITVAAVEQGYADFNCKGKQRYAFLPSELCKMLKSYVKEHKIKNGSIFISKNGNPLDRANIWSEMKKLSKIAGVSEKKVFPHNLRHLFARTYYSMQKDIVRLADILGHTSVNTTRIYTMETGEIHRKQIQKLGLIK